MNKDEYLYANNRDAYDTVLLDMAELYPTVNNFGYEQDLERITMDIELNGLDNPIVIFHADAATWRGTHFTQAVDMVACPVNWSDDKKVKLILCGNNRYRAAERLGYTAIDCVVVETLDEVATLCKKQRSL